MKINCKTIAVISFSLLFLYSCGNKKENNKDRIFYINYITNNDSLLIALKKSTSGKVCYFDNKRELQIISVNYLTEKHPKTHYFKLQEELNNEKPEVNSIKYELTFNNSRINDSIAYSFRKFIYTTNGWKFKSEMGIIKIFSYLPDYDKKLNIVNNDIAAAVIKTIAAETYGN